MTKFKFEIDYNAFYKGMLPMLIPIGLLYLILTIVPLLHFFARLLDLLLDTMTLIAIPREHMSGILTIFLGLFIFLTLVFLVFGVPLIITSAFRLICCPMNVTKKGLEAAAGPTFINDYYTLKWNDIQKVKTQRFFGLPYMVVSSSVSPPLWTPLFYDQQALMPEVFITLAPKENPIRIFFETNQHITRFDKK